MGRLRVQRRGALALALMLMGLLGAPALAEDAALRVAALEQQVEDLSGQVEAARGVVNGFMPFPPADVTSPRAEAPVEAPVLRVAQSRDVAGLNVRLGNLEEQVRVLTGQMEGLQFQMTQLQTLLQRMQEDTDARLAALEGGQPGKTDAASQSGGAMPAGEEPQTQLAAPDTRLPASDETLPGPAEPGPLPDGAIQLGAPEKPLGTLSTRDLQTLNTPGGRPLDPTFSGRPMSSNADADAQFQAGYDAASRGDYGFAEDQFRQFLALYPQDPKAPDATVLLGQALMQRGDYEQAAEVLLTGFQAYPRSPREPDILLTLGMAMTGAGETDTACRTFGEVERRFPGQSPDFLQRVAEEKAKAQCAR